MGGELLTLGAIFLGLAIVIVFAGNYMAKAADVIGEKSGMGASLAGLVLLAAATSLPELAININAVRLPDSTQGVDLTLGNVLGSSLFNLLILGIVDLMFHSKARMFSSISSAHALSAMVSMALIAIVVLFLLLERDSVGIPLHLWHLGIGTIACGVFYIFSVRLIYLDQQMAAKMEKEQESPQQEEERKSMSLGVAIGIYLATTVVIFIAAGYLAPTADRLAEITGLGGTFVGSTLLALTTSLPEFVTTIVAVRMGAADMAIGNILGSNTFNIAILLPIDAIYTKGSLLADASPVHAMTGMAVILLTSVATMGILYRAEKKKYSIIEPDALLVVLLSLLSIWGIYELTRPTGEPEIKDDPPIEEVSYVPPKPDAINVPLNR
ncbi:sodium:calcium antiporter [Bremerella sp. T1]|uniref:sodium:calcium antiporter n=1 Tax=Bremerella sp. TYQ1 TaxID=3119568 RepID=UPI001CCBB050|nr:hypothetical protein [Bremerella volcania]UBM34320.1 hypothetical protein LA756_16725 [Bremerella volcania]